MGFNLTDLMPATEGHDDFDLTNLCGRRLLENLLNFPFEFTHITQLLCREFSMICKIYSNCMENYGQDTMGKNEKCTNSMMHENYCVLYNHNIIYMMLL